MVIIGTFLYALTVNAVVIPNTLGEGGATGMTLMIFYWLGWNPAIVSFVLNAILLVIGWRHLEKRQIMYTIVSMFVMSVALEYTTGFSFVSDNTVVAAVAGGVLSGLAIGIVSLGGGTTGGTEIIAWIMKKYLGIGVSAGLLLIDFLVVAPLTVQIGLEKAILTLIMLYVMSKVLNFIIEGFNPKKSITIISKQHEAIAAAIQEKVDRGITILDGKGYYSREAHQILYIVINRHQLINVQNIIYELDPKAFVIITDVQQVIGEGFTFYLSDEDVVQRP
ncbi:YitT family protein [Fundicoccus ignavus]|nr:YitT family protein [Fundicoccus ignavus]